MSNSLKAIPIVVHFQQSQVSLGYRRGIEQKWDQIQFGVAFEIHVPYIFHKILSLKFEKGQIDFIFTNTIFPFWTFKGKIRLCIFFYHLTEEA